MAADQPVLLAPGSAALHPTQVIRREGEYWTIVFHGETCRLRDGRGIHYLAYLLRHPHEEIPALILERSVGTRPTDKGAGAQTELRDIRERARVNVTRAIGTALRRISTHHPHLAAHLRATIKTGTLCRYTPDPRLPLEWTE